MSGVFRNIMSPHPLIAQRGRTHSLGGEGVGVNSSEDARHCSVLYICKYFVFTRHRQFVSLKNVKILPNLNYWVLLFFREHSEFVVVKNMNKIKRIIYFHTSCILVCREPWRCREPYRIQIQYFVGFFLHYSVSTMNMNACIRFFIFFSAFFLLFQNVLSSSLLKEWCHKWIINDKFLFELHILFWRHLVLEYLMNKSKFFVCYF
jgi:hypothetical protein